MKRPLARDVFSVLYDTGIVRVCVRTDVPGLIIPAPFLRNAQLVVFEYGNALPLPTEDCMTDDLGIHATLSFERSPFATFVPWDAVMMMHGGPEPTEGMLIVLGIPDLTSVDVQPQSPPKDYHWAVPAARAAAEATPSQRGPFRVIDGGKKKDGGDDERG